jgi:SRSO17 transposase
MDDLAPPPFADLDVLDVQGWYHYWTEIEQRIGSVFARSDARRRAMTYLAGLLSPAERKNSWQLAEISGDPNPYGFQHLLGRADWEPEVLRDRLRTYVTDSLAAPDAIGVLDESGFLKKGTHSVGVARQYSGTAGRIENCQIGVFLAYSSCHGHTLLDRELYLPQEWTADRGRCRRVAIPAARAFATKPTLAQHMLARTGAAGVTLAWVTGDSIYSDNRPLWQWLEQRPQAYVLAVSGKEAVWRQQHQRQIKALLTELPREGWERISAGAGPKGPRWYDWLCLALSAPSQPGWKRWLLVRRSLTDPSELTAYIAFASGSTTRTALVRVAGTRWTIEESIQTAKGEVGLDQYEVRSWRGWYRYMTLAMWAQAFLTVVRAATGADVAPKKGRSHPRSASSLQAFKAHRGLRSA